MGVTLTNAYNRALRLTQTTSSLANSGHPGTLVSGLHYSAFGTFSSGTLGNGLPETATITPRGWLQSVNVGTSGSVYSLSIASYAPNGDILQANDNVNGNWVYTYDDFNRLVTSNKNNNQQAFSYVYDRFGNRWQQNVTAGTGPNPSYAFDAKNRITTTGVTYDSAGNVRNDGAHAYIYDAENRIIQVDGTAGQCSSATACYVYDAEGRRVRKTTGSVSVDYVYDLGGNVVSEISSSGGWNRGEVFAGAHHLATYSGGTGGSTYFIHADHLGSERVRTNVSGVAVETCTNLPFGDLQTCTGTDVSPLHFTGKQRDTETGNDDFGARYLNSGMGRWLTPDWSARQQAVPYADPGNPQTLNLYAYVLNNPTSHVDLDGHYGGSFNCQTPKCAQPEEGGGAPPVADEAGAKAERKAKAQKAKPLTAAQIQKQFYKLHGKAFAAAVNKVFGKDAYKVLPQTLSNAPTLDITKTRADLSTMGNKEPAESRNRPDLATSLAQNGTIFIPRETVASGNMKAISGDYAHELGNLLDFQIYGFRGPIGTEKNYGNPDKNTNEGDPDTGRNVEVTMFGSQQY
jgi:RHS repeat-associated protein